MHMIFDSYEFGNPFKITKWEPREWGGVYVILKPDIHVEHDSFEAIYFGQAENFEEPGFIESHGKYECWEREVGSKDDIFIAIYDMPIHSKEEREAVESRLINLYHPVCND